ncbi:MAG: glyoxalase, partial [Bacteroidetes bacterium]|nr:glyoxalase [Bacteroidota bacterium]
MSSRSEKLLQQRPQIPSSKIHDNMSREEYFQNAVLRPVLKLQNELFIAVYMNYIRKHKNVFHDLSLPKKMQYIENSVQRDVKFRNNLKGIILGQLTVEEFEVYAENSSALNKRMMNLLIERL